MHTVTRPRYSNSTRTSKRQCGFWKRSQWTPDRNTLLCSNAMFKKFPKNSSAHIHDYVLDYVKIFLCFQKVETKTFFRNISMYQN